MLDLFPFMIAMAAAMFALLAMSGITFPTSDNLNIQASTRELFIRSLKRQVFMRMPLMAKLLLRKRVTWRGGKFITHPVDKAELDDLSQSYRPGEPLRSRRKTFLDNPYHVWKYNQTPAVYDVEEELQNSGGPQTQVLDFTKLLVAKAHRATRIKLYKMSYGTATDADLQTDSGTAYTYDNGKDFCSIRQALIHDHTYGHVTRATTATNKWWQGASIDRTYEDHDVSYSPSINTFRRAKSAVQMYGVEMPGDLFCLCGPTIFQSLQSEIESRHMYNRDGAQLAKYGFNAMVIDGVEVVEDPFLTSDLLNAAGTTIAAEKWMFLLNINDWELRLHPKRAFAFTGFTWQGDKADGYDEWLARVLIAGNLCCWKPNGSIYLENVA